MEVKLDRKKSKSPKMDNSIIIGIFVPVQVLKIRGRSRERSGPPRFYYGSVCFIDKSFPLALNNLRAKVYSQLAVSTPQYISEYILEQ